MDGVALTIKDKFPEDLINLFSLVTGKNCTIGIVLSKAILKFLFEMRLDMIRSGDHGILLLSSQVP
jgi:hypothetical protein